MVYEQHKYFSHSTGDNSVLGQVLGSWTYSEGECLDPRIH